MGIECVRSQRGTETAVTQSLPPLSNSIGTAATFPHMTSSPSSVPLRLTHVSRDDTEHPSSPSNQRDETIEASLLGSPAQSRPTPPLGQLPTGKELDDLIQLYFSSVHRGYSSRHFLDR
jgi:hypothetical protein